MSGRKIIAGLQDALSHARGEAANIRERTVCVPDNVDVRAIRRKLDLTQAEFAMRFGFSLAAVRHWEQGDRRPEGPARVLLSIIDKEPDVVRRALSIDGPPPQKLAAAG